jgi:hypothetical protein
MTGWMKAYVVAGALVLGGHALGTGLGWFKSYRSSPIIDLRGMNSGGGSGRSGGGFGGGGFRGGK